ncbi:myristoylated virion core protein [Equine molluscum contagiosum-like virus]|nr:myristoylated virion core protein [Equine molluscum contagiosum-like virus]
MGAAASVQTAVTTINQKITHNLQQSAQASATTKCDISIGNIRFGRNRGCNVLVRNMCSSNASAQLDAIIKAATDTYNELSEEQKAFAPSLLTAALNIQTNVNTITKDFSDYVKQTCTANAVVNNTIKVQNLEVDDCSAPEGMLMTFEFVNTGTSQGNCAMKAVMDVLTKSSDRVSGVQHANNDFRWYIFAAVAVAVLLLLLWYAKRMLFTSTQDKIKLILASKPDVHWTTFLDTFFSSAPTVL